MAGKHEIVFAATDVLRIFPTFVWKAELEPEVHRRINKNIIHELERMMFIEESTRTSSTSSNGCDDPVHGLPPVRVGSRVTTYTNGMNSASWRLV